MDPPVRLRLQAEVTCITLGSFRFQAEESPSALTRERKNHSSSDTSSSFALVAMSSISRSSSFSLRQSSSFSYSRLTGRSLIGPFGPRSESFRGALRLFLGGASGPKLRFLRPPGAPPPQSVRGAQPPGRGAQAPPPPHGGP